MPDLFLRVFEFLQHLDQHIETLWATRGLWLYLIVFLIVFSETGLVVMPWLPGDSLLFVLGAFAAAGGPSVGVLIALLIVAAVLGNTCNYWIGRYAGPRLFDRAGDGLLSHTTLERAHAFYERFGPIAIAASRFVPVLRTVAPLAAGIGTMSHATFQRYSLLGSAAWVCTFVFAGYFFGRIPLVQDNLMLVMVGVMAMTCAPLLFAWLRSRSRAA